MRLGWTRRRQRELRMVWEVSRGGRISFLVGTAHFIPWSFRGSLERLLEGARTVCFEGPLEPDDLARVRAAGSVEAGGHLFDHLDRDAVQGITETLFPGCRASRGAAWLERMGLKGENPARALVDGMKPWLAFFTLWAAYLESLGWRHSVDREGYVLAGDMGRPRTCLETVEEQIQVLESLPWERIHAFLSRPERWRSMAEGYARAYADGDLRGVHWLPRRFPTRGRPVIGDRDRIFHERLQADLEEGGAVVFVGAPHIAGLVRLLEAEGTAVKRPSTG